MADSLLNTVKQGSQLFKESSEAVSGLSEKAGLPKAPTSPMETAVIGGSPSQAKMAGTPAALKAKATAPKIASSLKLATQERQAQADPALAAEQKRALELSQKLSGLGSLGQRVPDLIHKAVDAQLQGVNVKPVVDPSTFSDLKLSGPDQAALTESLNVLSDPSKVDANQHQKALVTVSNLTKQDLSKMDPSTLDKTVQGFFKKDTAANLEAAVSSSTPASVTLGMLGDTPDALGYNSWDSLATDLGLKVPEGKSAQDVLKGMSIKELGQTVDTIKRTGFQTQQEWMSVLQDPTSSLQDRQVARTMLTNMGASGVREAEQRTATLTAQVQAGNTVTVNLTGTPEKMAVEDVLKNDTLKGAIAVLLDPSKPGYKEVAEANPELLKWVQKNAAALQDQVKGISDDVSQFATNNAANAKILNTFAADDKTKDVLGKVLFPDSWGSFSAQKYDLASSPLFTNWAAMPEGEQTQVKLAIQTIADGGTAEDVKSFLGTNREQLKRLKLDTTDGVATFKSFWAEQKFIRSLGPTTDLSNTNSILSDLVGESPEQLAKEASTQGALRAIGMSSSLTLPATVQDAIGLAKTNPASMDAILKNGTLPVPLKDQIKNANTSMKAFAEQNPDPVLKSLGSAIIQKGGKLNKDEVVSLVTSASFKDDVAGLNRLKQLTGVDLSAQIKPAAIKQFSAQLVSKGAPALDSIASSAVSNPGAIPGYLNTINALMGSADPTIQADLKTLVSTLNRIKSQNDWEAKRVADEKERIRAENEQRARDMPDAKVTAENAKKALEKMGATYQNSAEGKALNTIVSRAENSNEAKGVTRLIKRGRL